MEIIHKAFIKMYYELLYKIMLTQYFQTIFKFLIYNSHLSTDALVIAEVTLPNGIQEDI
jgi:hypothetical protein